VNPITMPKFHLAQINIAQAKAEMDSPIMNGFTSRLDEINKIAEESTGFVWRLQDEAGDATSIRVFEDNLLLVNMSVWRSIEDLKNFVYRSFHQELLKNKNDWFNKGTAPYQAMWWVPVGHMPTVEEAIEKLELLRRNGPTTEVFHFGKPVDAPSMV